MKCASMEALSQPRAIALQRSSHLPDLLPTMYIKTEERCHTQNNGAVPFISLHESIILRPLSSFHNVHIRRTHS